MKRLLLPFCLLVVGVTVALVRGNGWESAALAGLFACLVGAMLETMPLIDWLYPKDEKPE